MSSPAPSVASVLLVAAPPRQDELASALHVSDEPVRYDLELAEPGAPPSGGYWNVIVVDGESIPTDDARVELLRETAEHRFAAVLYVASRIPSDTESAQAFAWASDVILQGWRFADRLRRRVASVALAPWRAATALRLEAVRLGDRRLRIVRTSAAVRAEPATAKRRLDRAVPFVLAERAWAVGGETPALVSEAFHEGRRIGVTALKESSDRTCEELLSEFQRIRPTLSPPEAQRYDGAADGVVALRYQLSRIAQEELEAIERHEARADRER
ncbi:MAG TPA: hypothetical protein PKD27_12490 [Tepidiformaceae bacterium]|nr:hypothetical protein [Tepidiformaceae bacterium]